MFFLGKEILEEKGPTVDPPYWKRLSVGTLQVERVGGFFPFHTQTVCALDIMQTKTLLTKAQTDYHLMSDLQQSP